ncbi:hypothetical protein MRX96_044968 [Rhipicephalus microplus]
MNEPRRSAATCNLETALTQPKQLSGAVRFMVTDGGRVRFNRILGTFDGPSWNTETTLKTVVVSTHSLLIDGTGVRNLA